MGHTTGRPNRRALLKLASAGGAALAPCAGRQTGTGAAAAPLAEGSRIEAGGRGPALVERARSLGREYEARNGSCAQCTVAALQDALDFVPKDEQVFLAASCLNGGATQGGNANCGGFTGAGMVIGRLCGRPRGRFSDRAAGRLASKLIREVSARFEQRYGSVTCKVVREKAGKNCPEVVAEAAAWTAEALLKQFSA